MSVEQLVEVLLAILGVILSLAFRYIPKAQEWLKAQSNPGLLMLSFVILIAGAYFMIACTTWAALFGITLKCNPQGAFDLLKALFIIAMSNQLAYLYTKK